MEQFEGFEKLKKMKNGNGMGWEKWPNQTHGIYVNSPYSNMFVYFAKDMVFFLEPKYPLTLRGI